MLDDASRRSRGDPLASNTARQQGAANAASSWWGRAGDEPRLAVGLQLVRMGGLDGRAKRPVQGKVCAGDTPVMPSSSHGYPAYR